MAIDKLLKRHFWAVILLLVAVAAFLDAQGIMQVVGASLGADEKQLAQPPLASHAAPPTTSRRSSTVTWRPAEARYAAHTNPL